uniref:Transcription initiation factor TFIID subunit 9 n=1 Tax=Syphacia muris TaxID=451379 RepID=A0A0N5AGG2_9BILA
MTVIPRDAQIVQAILREMSVVDYEPRIVSQLLEFAYRCTTEVLEDARSISEHAGKKQIDESDIQFAIDNSAISWKGLRPNRQLLIELAEQKNAIPLPPIRQNYGLRLPNDRFCLVQPNMQWKGEGHFLEINEKRSRNDRDLSERTMDGSRQMKPEIISNVLKRKANDDDDFDKA